MSKKEKGTGANATLDQRIAATLANSTADKEALSALHRDAVERLRAAQETIQVQSENELDLANTDPDAASEKVWKAQRTVARLNRAIPALRERIQQIEAVEYAKAWHADADQIEQERDALAGELAELYPAFVARLADLFGRIDACGARINRLHGAAPRNEYRRLVEAELVARDLASYSIQQPALRSTLKLPYWDNPTNHFPADATEEWNRRAFEASQWTIAAMANRSFDHPEPEWSDDPKKLADQMAQWNEEESALAERARQEERQRVRGQMAAAEAGEQAESRRKYEQSLLDNERIARTGDANVARP